MTLAFILTVLSIGIFAALDLVLEGFLQKRSEPSRQP